jgi:hypothetical protein
MRRLTPACEEDVEIAIVSQEKRLCIISILTTPKGVAWGLLVRFATSSLKNEMARLIWTGHSYITMVDVLTKAHGVAKQNFHPTRLGIFLRAKAYIKVL